MVSGVPLEALPSRRRTKEANREIKRVSTAFIEAVDRESSSLDEQSLDPHTSPSMRLRRDESIIAEAALLRKGHVANRLLHRVFLRVKSFFVEDIPSFVEGLIGLTRPVDGKRSISAVATRIADRVELLTPRKKAALVTAPYALALALVAALLLSGPSAPPAVTIAPAQDPALIPSAAAAALVPAAAPVAAPPAPVATPPAPLADPPAAEPAAATTAVAVEEQPERATELVRMVPIKSAIYAMPKKGAAKVARVKAGSNVITFPTIEAPEGWVVAKHTNGAIGYLPLKHFDGLKDEPLKKKAGKKKKAAKKRRKTAEAPWPS